MASPELLRKLGEANANLIEWQIQARRERKRQKRVSPATREALHAAEEAQRSALAECEAADAGKKTWASPQDPYYFGRQL